MIRFILPVLVIIITVSCSTPDVKHGSSDTSSKTSLISKASDKQATSDLCFIRTENNGRDSTIVQLIIKGNTVTGEMNWLPYQKDTRKGILNGTMNGDTIQATWTFKQEDVTDTMTVKYKLKNGQLSQRPLKVNSKTGRQQTDDAAGYTIEYSAYGGKM